jgi:hypothetical protein
MVAYFFEEAQGISFIDHSDGGARWLTHAGTNDAVGEKFCEPNRTTFTWPLKPMGDSVLTETQNG